MPNWFAWDLLFIAGALLLAAVIDL